MLSRLAACLALIAAFAAPATAQEVKPRILLIFDTSGSMGFDIETGENTGGDNSVEYPGNGGMSRLFVAKNVIRSIVETTSEVEFALFRYPQTEDPGGNDGTGRAPFTGYEGLADQPLNYAGFCNGVVEQDPDIADRSFSLAVGFEQDNENDILSWIDHTEDYPGNRELRAEGPTPLAETLRLARVYFRNQLRVDPALRCRRNYVVLLTDGAESCVLEDPGAAVIRRASELRMTRPVGGDEEKDIKTFVIAFSVVEEIAEALDDVARAGGTAVDGAGQIDLLNGQAFRANDERALRRAFSRILSEAIPGELCNGEDDDCDGNIDEGALNACGQCGDVPDELCNDEDDDCDGLTDEGVRNACGQCGELPVEVCNTIDDDCDGFVDEGVANPEGNCAPPTDEVCNGIDDDFDGRVDNQPGTADPLTRACSTDTGACEIGNEYCIAGRWGDCDGVLAAEEDCDGLDNDCDGITDEISRPCGDAVNIGDIGQCRVGRQDCAFLACLDDPALCEDRSGWSADCDDARGPSDEECDGVDNDCDGDADEGLFNACGVCGIDPPEACNGIDDNCDGRIDEDADCPRGYLCYFGECVLPCANGECGGETFCVGVWPGNSFCHPDPCSGVDCGEGFACSLAERGCYDPCMGIECGAGRTCELQPGDVEGVCVDETCHHVGCPDGQRCEAENCVADPCAAVDCPEGEFCRDGSCFEACRNTQCAPGERCLDGDCVPDDCGGRCLRGELCDPADGRCYADPCRSIDCPPGQACLATSPDQAECSYEAPCAHIECPRGTVCQDGACTDHTPSVEPTLGRIIPDAGPQPEFGLPEPDPEPEPPVSDMLPFALDGTPGDDEGGTDSDGCDCRADDGGPIGWFGLMAIGLWGLRRRRR